MHEKKEENSLNKYRIFETNTFSKDLKRIAKSGLNTIAVKLHDYVYPILKKVPHFGPQKKKLKNWSPPTWRYRIGSWRFFYEIDEEEKIVSMTAASHRSEAYRN
jgi:mRNA interferase RelE/StbE